MNHRLKFAQALSVALSCFLSAAMAAKPECNQGSQSMVLQDEKLAYQAADKELNTTWASVRKQLSEREFVELREVQRAWLGYRDLMASAIAGYGPQEKADHCADYLNAQASLTRDRTRFLRAWPQASGGNWSGSYQDSFGGSLQIVEQAGVAYFEIGAVRGYGMNNGQIAGFGAIKNASKVADGVVEFRAKDDESGEVVVRLQRQGARVSVETENAGSFHGHNAYFDGSYVRMGEIADSERVKIIRAGQAGPTVELETE